MDTTAAAQTAGVTRDTIRHWARTGAVKATKHAGRWNINPNSLNHRIKIGAHRAKKAPTMDYNNRTYTYTQPAGCAEPTKTITSKIKTRTTPDGKTLTIVMGIAPLLADQIDAIADTGNRLHTLELLRTASLVMSDQPRPGLEMNAVVREEGRISTTYRGTPDLPVSAVLDLGEEIRANHS